jgi:hypothetical protein
MLEDEPESSESVMRTDGAALPAERKYTYKKCFEEYRASLNAPGPVMNRLR